jgi:DNA-binding XRE family transcriptional regulator
MEHYYRKSYSRSAIKPPAPNVVVPSDYARRLRYLRRQLSMTQTQLATTIGAAGKAVSGSLEREALAGILEKD